MQHRKLAPLLLPLLLLLIFATIQPLNAKERGQISLGSNGGYKNLVIAVDRSWPEDPQLVEKIKSAVTEFSKQLSIATKPMFNNSASLHIAHVYILVPKTWTNNLTQIDSQSTWQTFDNSDIRLGRSPQQPHYTYHSESCGFPGDFTVFDTNHTLSTDPYLLSKQMLSEFGQLRWGLRSERNGEGGPHAYFEGGKLVPAICTKSIKGIFRHNETQAPCKVDSDTSTVEPSCRFYPDAMQEVEASLLGTTEVQSVEQFCDHWDSPVPELQHNKRAPVPLNACNGHGARDLMRKSKSGDFNTPPKAMEKQPAVQFTVVQPLPYRRLTLIIDISSSMRGDPLNKIKVGVDKFVRDLAEDGIECALVTFNHYTQLVKPLTFFNATQVRDAFAKDVKELRAGGLTAIGDALALGMRVLGVDPARPSPEVPGYMLLLTDGQENRYQNYTLLQAAAVLRNTSIIVDTVTFGPQADKRLSQLSEDTNGYSFFCKFENSTNDFIEQLSDTVRKRVEATQMPIEVFSSQLDASSFSVPVKIDKSVGKDTSFMLTTYRASDINSTDLKVRSPNGTVYDKNSPQYSKDPVLGTVTIKVSGVAETGEWRATDGRSTALQSSWSSAKVRNSRLALTVTSKASSSEEEPIVLDGSLSANVSVHLNRSTSINVVASLFRGFRRITGAKIVAKIESESSTDVVLELQDDGVFPDLEAGDGVYSAQVPLKSISKVQEYNVRLISDSPVSRVTSAGKFYVKSIDQGDLQNLPPSPVSDLKAEVHLPTKTLRLWWTAVGDEQSQGTAARYIIKSSDNDTLLEEDFHLADNVSVTVIPLVAGSIQSVNVSADQLASYNSTFYLAVMAVSSRGAKSELSNLVATQLKLPDNIDNIDGSLTSPMPSTSTLAPEIYTTKSGGPVGPLQSCWISGLLLGLISWKLVLLCVR
ncbi:hypothetical protein BOX15_Mlig018319g1 [Macrostomum lignano]|uniref:VWFA domain-containing protein n=1 Tax=Macrostomum lignano TaxID=282301 RepID=A0A267F8T7_9PLAT|nr:hypothetical protein BOX15_Mlig018319g1 [Macrostomum lignano]